MGKDSLACLMLAGLFSFFPACLTTGASAGPGTACHNAKRVLGSRGQSRPCSPGSCFPRGGVLSRCFCPCPSSVLPPMTRRAHGAVVPSPQLHLGRRGGCLHGCKTRARCHTPLAPPAEEAAGRGTGAPLKVPSTR